MGRVRGIGFVLGAALCAIACNGGGGGSVPAQAQAQDEAQIEPQTKSAEPAPSPSPIYGQGADQIPRTNRELRALIARTVDDILNRDAKNFQRERQRIAAHQTAEFVDEHMPTVKPFPNAFGLLSHSVSQVDEKLAADGLWAEFGVFSGKSINHIAWQTKHTVHGFDSFEGLPEDWRTNIPKGTFKMDGLPEVRENVLLHKGWFDKSVPVWAKEYEGPMAFIHFDADLYSSTKTIFDLLGDRIVPGSILQFDEYFNYPGWKQGEYRAFMEFVKARNVTFEYIGYTEGGYAESVAVRITGVGRGKEG